MELLLLQTTPAMGGANKANRALLADLVARGHRCSMITPAFSIDEERDGERVVARLEQRGFQIISADEGEVIYLDRGIIVHAILDEASGPDRMRRQIERDDPTWVLVAEEDMALTMLEITVEQCAERVVFLSHTPLMLPFGPDCFLPNAQRTALLHRVAGVVTPSLYLRDYFREHTNIDAQMIRYPVYEALRPESGVFPRLGNFEDGLVMMVNPCSYKGISIFLALAQAFPDVPFGAVPTWGTSSLERKQLEAQSNIELMAPVAHIGELFEHSKILLAPSLWGEAFGQIAVESMLFGIPTLASNSGGLKEAKLGIDYSIPVRKIERFERRFDERMLPLPIVPPQNITPWTDALRSLLADREHYENLAEISYLKANTFIEEVRATSAPNFETFLADLSNDLSQASSSGPPPSPNKRSRRSRLRGWVG